MMYSSSIIFAAFLALASAPWGSLAAQPKCYFPNGSEIQSSNTTTYEACNGIAGATSQCCATSEGCSANGLCVSSEGQYSRGGCTDPTFQSPFCLSICTSILLGGTSSGAADVLQCTDGTWCCGDDNSTTSCCVRGEGINLPATIGIDKGDSASMSNTVKVSIGAGIGAAAIISLGIVSFIYWKRRQHRKRELEQQLAILSPTRSDHGLLPFFEEPRSEKERREMVARPKAARLSS